MIRSRRSRWLSGIGTVVLIGGLVLANYGSGVTSAEATNPPPNPFTQILNKLDQILAAITGGGEGNHTLRWDTNNASAIRFTTAFTGAVLDNNTGLVWEQAPDATARLWQSFGSPAGATNYCVNKNVGGTVGWRLPSVVELRSVLNGSSTQPLVPATVFSGVQSAGYWSATTHTGNPAIAWGVNFLNGDVVDGSGKTGTFHAWCVRGPMSESAL